MNFSSFFEQGQQLNLEDREQIKTEELTGKTLTITAATIAHGNKGDYAICIANEFPKKFFFAPSILTRMLKQIMHDEEARKAMETGEFAVVLTKQANKSGTKEYYKVEVK